VKKTSTYLDPETDRALSRLAEAGSGPGDVADDVDRHLEKTGFGSR